MLQSLVVPTVLLWTTAAAGGSSSAASPPLHGTDLSDLVWRDAPGAWHQQVARIVDHRFSDFATLQAFARDQKRAGVGALMLVQVQKTASCPGGWCVPYCTRGLRALRASALLRALIVCVRELRARVHCVRACFACVRIPCAGFWGGLDDMAAA